MLALGIDKYNEECRSIVMKCVGPLHVMPQSKVVLPGGGFAGSGR